jgi:hypothetical protein
MSIDQLDEGGSKVEIEDGVLRIWDWRKWLLVKVRCSANRLYILHLNVAKTSPRARTMRRGAGMSISAISTSTRFIDSPGTTWCTGCR